GSRPAPGGQFSRHEIRTGAGVGACTSPGPCRSRLTTLTAARARSQDHRPHQCCHPGEGAAAGLCRLAVGQQPEMVELHRRKRGRRGKLRAMTLIDFSKKITDLSEKTPHLAPRSVGGAANLAASSRGSRTTVAVCDLVVRAEQEVKMANLYVFHQASVVNNNAINNAV